jgi:hypothetical protein
MRLPFLGVTACGLIAFATFPAAASAAPTITLDTPVVQGNAVSLSAMLTSNGSCGVSANNLGGCPANYKFSGPIPYSGANLWWNDFGGVQPIPQDFNLLRGFPAGTYTVWLDAIDSHGTHHASNSQQFTWPAGQLVVDDLALTGGPRVAYRVAYGQTPFASGKATIVVATPAGRRLGSFRRGAEPGRNVDTIPRQLRVRLDKGGRYVLRIEVSDEYGRAAKARATVTG